MSITPEENVELWKQIRAKAMQGAKPAADAMARYLVQRARTDTLMRSRHPAGEWHRARPGEPPATASGNLARHMFFKPASSGLRATAVVGNDAEYSRILEFGCVVSAYKRYLHWKDSGSPVTGWFHTQLVIPPHPYLEPTVREAVEDGELHDVAVDAFAPYDP